MIFVNSRRIRKMLRGWEVIKQKLYKNVLREILYKYMKKKKNDITKYSINALLNYFNNVYTFYKIFNNFSHRISRVTRFSVTWSFPKRRYKLDTFKNCKNGVYIIYFSHNETNTYFYSYILLWREVRGKKLI